MAVEFVMPKLGLTMEEGTITEWLVDDGAAVERGATVLRIETDKTETDVEVGAGGRLVHAGEVGGTYACGQLIGWILADGEQAPIRPGRPHPDAARDVSPRAASGSPAGQSAALDQGRAGDRVFVSPNARRVAAERGLDLSSVRGTGPHGRIVSQDLHGVVAPTPPARPTSGVPATIAGRHLADLLGVDLGAVAPDPADGRVTRESVARHVRTLLAAAAGAEAARAPTAATGDTTALQPATQVPSEVIAFKGIRGTIATRMHGSLAEMAQLTLFMDADLDAVVADRARRVDAPPSYTDYVIAAVARALVTHPRVNSQVTSEGIALLPAVHVGVAVALDDGLIVPVVRNTPTLTLEALSAETARLASAARDGSLAFSDIEGGTFSVSTLGMYGVDGFTPVVNPPNTAILGVGRLRDDVVADEDGSIVSTRRMTLSLTWDHRVFDGAPAAAFTRTVCELLQRPADLDRPVAP